MLKYNKKKELFNSLDLKFYKKINISKLKN